MTPEVPGAPTTLRLPRLRQDLRRVVLRATGDGRYALHLPSAEAGGAAVGDNVDLRPFVPFPRVARGNATLERIALSQREFNRYETDLGAAEGAPNLRLANNCLRQGLWEVIVSEFESPGGRRLVRYHGWFDFPAQEYARLYTSINGVPYGPAAAHMAQYPAMGGFDVPLATLRQELSATAGLPVVAHLDEAIVRYPEQERKARLLVRPAAPRVYRDFMAPGADAVVTAKFSEPGIYTNADPMRFDLSWLAHPADATWRRTRNAAVPGETHEIEVRFDNGHRLLVADAALAAMVAHPARPTDEAALLRLTFGIGTPEIYGDTRSRATEHEEDRPAWLLLLDRDGRAVDNHFGGLDRVYLWREAGTPGRLHLLLVGYERIAMVGHLSLPWHS